MSDGMHYGTYLEVPGYSSHNRTVRAQCPSFCSFTLRCQRDFWLKLDVSVTRSLTQDKVPRTWQDISRQIFFRVSHLWHLPRVTLYENISHNGDLRLEKSNCHLLEIYFPLGHDCCVSLCPFLPYSLQCRIPLSACHVPYSFHADSMCSCGAGNSWFPCWIAIFCNFVLFFRYIALTKYIVIMQTKNSTWALESKQWITGKCPCEWSDLLFCCMDAVCYVIYRLYPASRPTRA